jgi:hypothetical protein
VGEGICWFVDLDAGVPQKEYGSAVSYCSAYQVQLEKEAESESPCCVYPTSFTPMWEEPEGERKVEQGRQYEYMGRKYSAV